MSNTPPQHNGVPYTPERARKIGELKNVLDSYTKKLAGNQADQVAQIYEDGETVDRLCAELEWPDTARRLKDMSYVLSKKDAAAMRLYRNVTGREIGDTISFSDFFASLKTKVLDHVAADPDFLRVLQRLSTQQASTSTVHHPNPATATQHATHQAVRAQLDAPSTIPERPPTRKLPILTGSPVEEKPVDPEAAKSKLQTFFRKNSPKGLWGSMMKHVIGGDEVVQKITGIFPPMSHGLGDESNGAVGHAKKPDGKDAAHTGQGKDDKAHPDKAHAKEEKGHGKDDKAHVKEDKAHPEKAHDAAHEEHAKQDKTHPDKEHKKDEKGHKEEEKTQKK